VRPLLLVLNPRDIRECVESISRLPVDKAWLRSYTEAELAEVLPEFVRTAPAEYDYFLCVSDDCVVQPAALAAVLELAERHEVVTGYTRLDATSPFVNITKRDLAGDTPVAGAYDFYTYADVAAADGPEVFTGFVGFALTGMSRELWERFPFRPFGGGPTACASDFSLSIRLRDAGVPMVAATGGYVEHVKQVWNQRDTDPRKRLLIGERPAEIIIQTGEDE
jgi:GT2 family glycosyltransferase